MLWYRQVHLHLHPPRHRLVSCACGETGSGIGSNSLTTMLIYTVHAYREAEYSDVESDAGIEDEMIDNIGHNNTDDPAAMYQQQMHGQDDVLTMDNDAPVEVPVRIVSGGKVKPGGGFVAHAPPPISQPSFSALTTLTGASCCCTCLLNMSIVCGHSETVHNPPSIIDSRSV